MKGKYKHEDVLELSEFTSAWLVENFALRQRAHAMLKRAEDDEARKRLTKSIQDLTKWGWEILQRQFPDISDEWLLAFDAKKTPLFPKQMMLYHRDMYFKHILEDPAEFEGNVLTPEWAKEFEKFKAR